MNVNVMKRIRIDICVFGGRELVGMVRRSRIEHMASLI
jgi:hypothetical protein